MKFNQLHLTVSFLFSLVRMKPQ